MFVVIDGVDGSGKTYAIRQIARQLRKKGLKVRTVLGNQLGRGVSRSVDNLLKSRKLLNLKNPDVKALTYLAIAVTVWEDLVAWCKKNPDGVLIKDRSLLTVLIYSQLAEYDYVREYMDEQLLWTVLNRFQAPDFLFMFLPDFDYERVKHRKELKQYYRNFEGEKVKLMYEAHAPAFQMKHPSMEMVVCRHKTLNHFDARNRLIATIIELAMKEKKDARLGKLKKTLFLSEQAKD